MTNKQFANDTAGIKALLKSLSGLKVCAAVEASGGYEEMVAQTLDATGISVVRVDPRRVRHFAYASGKLAKTDRVDAKCIALYLKAAHQGLIEDALAPVTREEGVQQLRDLSNARRLLVDQKCTLERQCGTLKYSGAIKPIKRTIAQIERSIAALEGDIRKCIADHRSMKRKAKIMQSVPGVGFVLSTTLLAFLPELGGTSRQRIAALVGIAPYHRQSGTSDGKRHIWGGRHQIRKVLYMAAISGARSNPDFKQFYNRLKDNGKPSKIALCAVMRKMIVLINTLIAEDRIFNCEKPIHLTSS